MAAMPLVTYPKQLPARAGQAAVQGAAAGDSQWIALPSTSSSDMEVGSPTTTAAAALAAAAAAAADDRQAHLHHNEDAADGNP